VGGGRGEGGEEWARGGRGSGGADEDAASWAHEHNEKQIKNFRRGPSRGTTAKMKSLFSLFLSLSLSLSFSAFPPSLFVAFDLVHLPFSRDVGKMQGTARK